MIQDCIIKYYYLRKDLNLTRNTSIKYKESYDIFNAAKQLIIQKLNSIRCAWYEIENKNFYITIYMYKNQFDQINRQLNKIKIRIRRIGKRREKHKKHKKMLK
ncbi:unnamed protein product [Paramecium sonneborni]|uniref:Uncharacterized protein n=1 Tax=Paramecium sonneborni TaxID=65129 RepID=A0A8S1JY64_9CILI|nr:unnamed protein product [Paramecium sonneborni]